MFIHYNMRYDWMRPSTEEIVAAYIKTYGSDPTSRGAMASNFGTNMPVE